MNDIVKKAREIPIREAVKKDLDNDCEIDIFLYIDAIGGFIWRLNHDMADGRIDESEHAALNKDIKTMTNEMIYAVSQLTRCGIDVPFQNEKFAGSDEYWTWYNKWKKYIKDLSEETWKDLQHKLEAKEDVSSFHP